MLILQFFIPFVSWFRFFSLKMCYLIKICVWKSFKKNKKLLAQVIFIIFIFRRVLEYFRILKKKKFSSTFESFLQCIKINLSYRIVWHSKCKGIYCFIFYKNETVIYDLWIKELNKRAEGKPWMTNRFHIDTSTKCLNVKDNRTRSWSIYRTYKRTAT